MRRLLLLLVLVGLVAAPRAEAAKHAIHLEGEHGAHLADFETATYKRSGKRFTTRSVSTNGRWVLKVDIKPFHGYDELYDLDFESAANAIYVWRKGDRGHFYSNVVDPPAPVPAFGLVTFRKQGGLMGVGFGPAMYQRGDSAEATGKAVTLAGAVRRVPRR